MRIPLGLKSGLTKIFRQTPVTMATSLVWNDAIYASGGGLTVGPYFAFGQAGSVSTTSTYNYSSDGVTWSTGTLAVACQAGQAVWNGTTLVIGSWSDQNGATPGSTNGFQYTTNGTTWTAVTNGGLRGGMAGLWTGTNFLMTGGNSTTNLWYSTTGTSFTGIDVAVTTNDINWDGSRKALTLFASSSTTYNTTSSGTSSANWNATTMPSNSVWASCAYGNSIWVFTIAGSATYATCGSSGPSYGTFTTRTLPSLFSETSADTMAKIRFVDGAFVYYYTDKVYKSTDGINWTSTNAYGVSTIDQATGFAAEPTGAKTILVGYGARTAGEITTEAMSINVS